MLKSLHGSDILLAPLRSQEAVISSRMEGTVSTIDEVLRLEAEQEEDGEIAQHDARSEAVEVYLHARAMALAQVRTYRLENSRQSRVIWQTELNGEWCSSRPVLKH